MLKLGFTLELAMSWILEFAEVPSKLLQLRDKSAAHSIWPAIETFKKIFKLLIALYLHFWTVGKKTFVGLMFEDLALFIN